MALRGRAIQGKAWLFKAGLSFFLNYRTRLGKALHGWEMQGWARLFKARLFFHTLGGWQMDDTTVVKATKTGTIITREVTLCGTKDIMFDRYPGDNNTKLEPHQKLYLKPGTKVIGLPALNIMSFLTAVNTNSAPKRLRDKRKYKDIANAILSFSDIGPSFIPFTRNGKPILFGAFDSEGYDPVSECSVHYSVARLEKGIPNPKVRPLLPLPWSLSFTFSLRPNREIKEVEILNLLEEGGAALGLGTFRGVFGKFVVVKWDSITE